jgi:hypothetical protein
LDNLVVFNLGVKFLTRLLLVEEAGTIGGVGHTFNRLLNAALLMLPFLPLCQLEAIVFVSLGMTGEIGPIEWLVSVFVGHKSCMPLRQGRRDHLFFVVPLHLLEQGRFTMAFCLSASELTFQSDFPSLTRFLHRLKMGGVVLMSLGILLCSRSLLFGFQS